MANKLDDILKAGDLSNLLEHIAWEGVVQPALHTYRARFQQLLVQSVLGQQIIDQATGGIVSKEMLAGRIEGIDWLEKFLENILRRGERAEAALRQDNLIIK